MADTGPQFTVGAEDGHRRSRSEQISKVDPTLAALYLRACEFVEQPISIISMSMLGHAMRELLNGLADVLAEIEGIDVPPRQDESNQVRALVVAWEAANLPTDAGTQIEVGEEALHAVPTTVFSTTQAVVRGQLQITANSSEKMARIVSAGADTVVPAAKQLKRTYEFFMDWCHVERTERRPLPSADKVGAAFAYFESVVDVRLSSFFDIKSDLDDILKATNKPINVSNEESTSD